MTERFLKYLQDEKRYSYNTLEAYRNDLHQFQAYLVSQYSISDFRQAHPAMIRSWVVYLLESGYSRRSVHRKISSLNSYAKFLMQRYGLSSNPASSVRLPRLEKRLPGFLKETEMESMRRLFQEVTGFSAVRDQLLLEMLYQTGMRRAELIGLTDGDVHTASRELRIFGKGNKERIVPFGRSLSELVDKYLNVRHAAFPDGCADRLFVTDKGRPLYPKWVYNRVRKYLGAISEQSKISPHIIRHSFATHLADNGADLNAVKEMLGHASLASTQVYTHNSIESLKKIYEQAHPKGKRS